MTRRPTRPRAYAPDPQAPAGRFCEMRNCTAMGEYRAPKSRAALGDYWWFCLEHVRAYNASWDFYKGMSADQIEQQMRADTHWQRPTWPLGSLGGRLDDEVLRAPLGALHAGLGGRARPAPPPVVAPPELRQPLEALGLAWPVAIDTLKSRYKTLAKEHHPDRHGGDRAAEERLKTINLAYAAVRQHIQATPPLAATG